MFQTKDIEKIKTRILCSITFFSENRAVYEIKWENVEYPDMPPVAYREGVQPPPPPEIPKALKNRAKLNPIVKIVKNG